MCGPRRVPADGDLMILSLIKELLASTTRLRIHAPCFDSFRVVLGSVGFGSGRLART